MGKNLFCSWAKKTVSVLAASLLLLGTPLEIMAAEYGGRTLAEENRGSSVSSVASEQAGENDLSSTLADNEAPESTVESEPETQQQESTVSSSSSQPELSAGQENMNRMSADAVLDDWYMQDGKRYYKLADGNNAVGWFTSNDGKRCYAWPSDGEIRAGFLASNGYTYYVDDFGVKQVGYFTAVGGKRYYAHYFGGVEVAQGWFTADNGERCYAWEGGEIRAGFVDSNGYTYYVNNDGAKQTGYFIAADSKRYYAHYFGGVEVAQGWFTADNGERCYAWEGGEIRAGFVDSNGYTYYVNNDGAKQTGYFIATDGKRYYAHYFGGVEAKQGWFTADNGERCYAWENGEIRPGFVDSNGYTYYVNNNGTKQTGYFTATDGKRYYAHYFGGVEAKQGWFTADNGERCYGWEGGEIRPGFVDSNGYTYYVNNDGAKQTGYFAATDGKRYYAHGFGGVETKQGWFTADNGQRCYAWVGGEIRPGFVNSNGYTYYVNKDGVKQTGYFTTTDGKRYYAHGFGGVETKQGWFTADNGQRCYAREGGEIRPGFVDSNGYTYYVNNDGVKQTGYFTATDGKRYYAHGFGGVETKQGWFTADNGQRCYAREGGEIRPGFVNSNGYSYYVNNDGVKQTGYFTATDGKRYYAHSFGAVETKQGWFTADNGQRCYARENGEIRAGFINSNNFTYYVNENGVKQTGYFAANDGKCYYAYSFGGVETRQGWFAREDGVRFYARENGEIRAGVLTEGSQAYYLNWNGEPIKGHFKGIDGKWYFSNSSGQIKKGWVEQGATSYYVGNDWALLTGLQKIDGVEYRFSDTGLFIPKPIAHTGVGIDVSVNQGNINWKQVAESGKVDFVIVRALHWDKAKGGYSIDPYFVQNVTNAKRYGLKVGAYLYSYAFNQAQFRQEIDFFLNSPEMKNLMASGFKFDLPVFIDYEDALILKNTSGVTTRTQDLLYGMTYLEVAARNRGYNILPGFYSMHDWACGKVFDGRYLQNLGYDFWLAQWNSVGHSWGDHPAIWQYSNSGYIPGINARVDLNYMYKKYW